jgi:hypothetical protein
MLRAREAKSGDFFLQQAVRAMEDVLPDEIVSLHQSGEMTARSAVQEVMLKWSAQQRATARNTRAGIIFRMSDPPILGIVEIEELWCRPEFKEGDDTSRTVTIWIVMDESGDCEVPPIRMQLLTAGMMNFSKKISKGRQNAASSNSTSRCLRPS